MAIELKVPSVGESIKEVIIGTWMKNVGDAVETDEPVVEIDSDKASQELGAPGSDELPEIPPTLPVLPVRERVAFPGTVMPLNVAREKSKKVLTRIS